MAKRELNDVQKLVEKTYGQHFHRLKMIAGLIDDMNAHINDMPESEKKEELKNIMLATGRESSRFAQELCDMGFALIIETETTPD